MVSSLPLARKVLIVSSWAPPAIGGPQNLYHLFSRFPNDSYCLYTSEKNFHLTEYEGTRLPGRYYFFDRPAGPPGLPPRAVGVPFFARAVRRWTLGLYRLARSFLLALREGRRIIQQERIEVLVGVSDYGFSLLLTFALSKLCRLPYALYLFDLYRGPPYPQPWQQFSHFFEPHLLRQAGCIFVTNPDTERYYRERYGKTLPLTVIYNVTDRQPYERLRTAYQPRPPFTVLLTGHIYWPQERSIRNLARAVATMPEQDVRLVLYAPTAPEWLRREFAGNPRVMFTAAAQTAMPTVQCRADVLVLALSWGTLSREIIETATPGKLTDYLVAGRPILIHAPPYAYVARYARERGFAHVVDEEDIGKLQDGIRKLLTDLPYARRLVTNALETFAANHDADVNARRFAEIINRLPPHRFASP